MCHEILLFVGIIWVWDIAETGKSKSAILMDSRRNRRVKQDLVASVLAPSTVVPPHQRTDIECLPDAISIFLPETLLPERRNITWREEMCKADFNGTHYVSVIALSECGTTVSIQNDTVTFYNELIVRKVADDIQDVNSDSDVTYGSDYETVIPVQCIYPRHSNVSSSYIPVKQNVRFFEKHYGDLDVYMQQFDSEDFKFTIPVDGSPRKVPLNDDLYIRVGLNFDPVDVRVKADQCIATSSPNPADSHWRQLINDGCPVNNVRLLTGSDSSDVKFTLKAFDFRHNASGFVYLHCQVSICGAVDDRCRMGCSARVKRSAAGSDRTLLVSTGPFYVERRNQNNAVQESLTAQTIVAAVCFLVAIVAVIMAVIGWKRPRDPKSTNF